MHKTPSTQHLVSLGATAGGPSDGWPIARAPPRRAPPALRLPQSLWVAKAWYFTCCGALALVPYLNLLLKERGLTAVQIGGLLALRPWLSALSGALWGVWGWH